jgi:hypothetical protein
MIVHMSVHSPKPGREQELIASMQPCGAAGRTQPGLIDVRTSLDGRAGRLISMARREDEASREAGVEVMRAAVADDPFDEWEAAAVDGFFLEEV